MELHQIRYFLAVADTLNFTRAAEECHVAQPSLSRAIRKLEDELGGELFRRERNRTHLTELGREMLPILRQVFDTTLVAKELAESLRRSERAPLRLGVSQTVHLEVIAPILVELSHALPALELHIRRSKAGEILQILEQGDVELAIAGAMDATWDRLDRWRLFEEPFVLLSADSHLPSPVSLRAIEPSLIIARPYCETLAQTPNPTTGDGHDQVQRYEVSSDGDAARLVGCGLGFAIVPESTGRLHPDLAHPILEPELIRSVCVYGVVGRRRSAAAGAFLKLLRAADWPSHLVD